MDLCIPVRSHTRSCPPGPHTLRGNRIPRHSRLCLMHSQKQKKHKETIYSLHNMILATKFAIVRSRNIHCKWRVDVLIQKDLSHHPSEKRIIWGCCRLHGHPSRNLGANVQNSGADAHLFHSVVQWILHHSCTRSRSPSPDRCRSCKSRWRIHQHLRKAKVLF